MLPYSRRHDMKLYKLLPYWAALVGVVFIVSCSSENEFDSLEQWVSVRQTQQLPGSELIEKVKTNAGYFAVFRDKQKIVLLQRVVANESVIGGYSSNLSVDDAEGLDPNVIDPKVTIDLSKIYRLAGRIYKEKTISLDINTEYEGKLHISYRWRPIVLSTGKISSDPLIIDVETFWINASS